MRRVTIVLAAAAMVAALAPAARAGGGGCHEEQSTEGTGTRVALKDFCFAPTVIHVRPGDTVTWENVDDAPHTVTGMPGTFDSDDLKLGDKFTHTFAEAGTFAYYCVVHRRMAGAVVVAGDISKAGLVSGSAPSGDGESASTPAGSKRAGSSAALPITALALAVPIAAGLGFGAGRRGQAHLPS